MSEFALERIKEAKEKRLTQLNLGNCGLTELPDELFELVWLEELIVCNNNVSNNFKEIKILQHLTYLDIRWSDIKDLSPLKNLKKLKTILLYKCPIEDLSPIRQLYNLEYLMIGSTKIKNLEPLIDIVGLKKLDIGGTQITDLTPLKNLKELEHLAAFKTQINNLKPLKNLSRLKHILINDTLVSDLTPLKGIIDNGINIKNFSAVYDDDGIYVKNCPLAHPPFYIIDNGYGAIHSYFKELENKETITNNQTKLIFIGNSRAGKTSLWQFLKDKIYTEQVDSTHGIRTEIWDTETLGTEDNQNLAAHIWDFGGQEYYHATHRLFLADNAVYVLVWEKDSNKQGTRLEKFKLDDEPNGEIEEVDLEHFPASYWLDNIRYFGGTHCPILIVQNKVDEEYLKANYTDAGQNIEDCFHLSVQNAYHFQEGNATLKRHDLKFQDFKERLLELLRKNATAFKLVKYYAQVREALEALAKEKEFITVSELKEIALGFDETPDLENLLAYLKSFTNTVLYFPQNPLLHDRLYLNPTHISRDIYKILNKTVRDNKGKFDLAHIKTRLNLPNYEEAERFLALMHEFDLIFEKQDENDDRAFIAPQYLQQKAGLATGEKMILKTFQPAFYLRFKSFVPRSMMLRFIAQNGASAFEEFYWRNGIVYQGRVPNTFIKVEYDSEARKFAVDVQDKDKQAVDMQQVVAQFIKLNNSDDNIDISNDGKTYIELKTIRKLQHENRRDNIFIEGHVVSLDEYDWLIKKQRTNDMTMTLKELKEKVRNLISKAKIKEAMDEIATWAHEQNQEQLKNDIAVLKRDYTDLSREKMLGLLGSSDSNIRQNQLANKVLNLLDSIEEKVSIEESEESNSFNDLKSDDDLIVKLLESLFLNKNQLGVTNEFAHAYGFPIVRVNSIVDHLIRRGFVIQTAPAAKMGKVIKLNYEGELFLKNAQSKGNIEKIDKPFYEQTTSSDKLKILMLTANPAKTTKLNLDKEHSNIVVKLENNPEKFSLTLRKAVTSTEFKEFTETLKPDILHFSGHGEGGNYGGIVVQNDDKNAEELISIDGLDALFEYFQDQNVKLKIVLLNACYSEEQALTISKYVPFVVGTNVAIGDVAASAFSTGFYYKLAASENLDYEQAFKSGRTEATLKGAARSNFILFKDGVKAPI
jgi:internalin A